MRLDYYCSLAFLATMAATLAVYLPSVDCKNDAQRPTTRDKFELPKIFDFELFKRTFHKDYADGHLEEPARRKYMLARAFRAFISAVKYKHREIGYHLALNHLSDKSPHELDRMRNKMVAEGLAEYLENADEVVQVDPPETNTGVDQMARWAGEIPEVDPREIEETLDKLASSAVAPGSEEFARIRREMQAIDELDLSDVKRNKREAPAAAQRRPSNRALHLGELINSAANVHLDAETRRKVELKPAGNNPNYQAPELTSCGARDDDLEELDWTELEVPPGAKSNIVRYTSDMLSGYEHGSAAMHEDNDDDDQQDVVYFDHRDSKCLFLPRDQGECGSCYAFGAVAIAEWLYCIKNGHLVPFSEQYIVDCGAGVGNRGCEGGNHFSIGYFLHNYGMELRSNYPYSARQDECPYDEDTDPKSMGYIRMELGSAVIVPMDRFAEYIKYSPLFITICTKGDFHEYKRGVHVNPHCNGRESDHVVVLIGHGREDGQEYWLIRNSHSIGWGEAGHYKLAKASTVIYPRTGVVYGTTNGVQYHISPNENQLNDKRHVKARYMAKMDEVLASDDLFD